MQPMMPPGAVCAVHPAVPATGTCTRCGSFVCAACTQGGPYCEKCRALVGGPRTPPPWERRSELGFFKAFVEQWKLSMFSPEIFWRSLPANGSMTEPLIYAWLLGVIQAIPSFFVQAANFGQVKQSLALIGKGNVPPFMDNLSPWVFAAVLTVGPIVFFPLSFFIGAGLVHLGCKLWGAGDKGFDATARVMGYAQAPIVFGWVPMIGFVAIVYLLVLQILGVARVQEVSGGKAAGGVLTIPLALGCLCGCLFGLGAMAAIGAVSR